MGRWAAYQLLEVICNVYDTVHTESMFTSNKCIVSSLPLSLSPPSPTSLQLPYGIGNLPFSGLFPSLPTQSSLGGLGGFGSLIDSQQLRTFLCNGDRSQLDRFIHFGNNVSSVSFYQLIIKGGSIKLVN